MALSGWKRTWLIRGGYGLFALVAFVWFAYLTFPYDRLKSHLIRQVGKPAEPGAEPGQTLQVGELEPHWFTGIEAADVRYTRRGVQPGQPDTVITLDRLTARRAVLPALIGNLRVDFSAAIGTGEATGSVGDDGEVRHVEAELESVSLAQLGLEGSLGVPVTGMLSGEIDLELSDDPAQTHGSVYLKFENLAIGDGEAKVAIPGMRGGLTLEKIQAGTLELHAVVEEGVAQIKKLEGKGKDLELEGSGSVRLGRDPARSRLDVTLGVTIKDSYKNRSERTKAIFSLMESSPQLKQAMGPGGAIRYQVGGTLAAPRAQPAGQARGRALPGKTRRPMRPVRGTN